MIFKHTKHIIVLNTTNNTLRHAKQFITSTGKNS